MFFILLSSLRALRRICKFKSTIFFIGYIFNTFVDLFLQWFTWIIQNLYFSDSSVGAGVNPLSEQSFRAFERKIQIRMIFPMSEHYSRIIGLRNNSGLADCFFRIRRTCWHNFEVVEWIVGSTSQVASDLSNIITKFSCRTCRNIITKRFKTFSRW